MGHMSKLTISRLIKASPAMLSQYLGSKKSVVRARLINLLDADMLRDVLYIIHLPPPNYSSRATTRHHVELWATDTLPSPFKGPDSDTLDKLDRLFSRLIFFIEDYLTKATAPFPPRAALCLPRITGMKREWYFKDQTVEMNHVTIDDLTDAERNRLLRSFVRFELLSKFYLERVWRAVGDSENGDMIKELHSNLDIWEYEMLHCVSDYAHGLYAALFAHSIDACLPDDQSASNSGSPKGNVFIYPDNLCITPSEYFVDLDLPRCCAFAADDLRLRGFDLLTHVLGYSSKEQESYKFLRTWFLAMSAERGSPIGDETGLSLEHFLMKDLGPESVTCIESGIRGRLLERIWGSIMGEDAMSWPQDWDSRQLVHLKTYRHRAWPFFDNARLYPGTSSLSHFPTQEYLDEQERLVKQRFRSPASQRQRLRSQKWQDYYCGRSPESESKDWGEHEDRLGPDLFDKRRIPRFFEDPVPGRPILWWRERLYPSGPRRI
ncbi:hypothetical protein ACHAPT_002229 [Fusarium lateritium]